VRARIAASVGLAAFVTLATAGCGFIAPQATTDHYTPSDGTNATVGDLMLLNAIVLSEDGEEGNLIANIRNSSSERITVTLQYESGSKTIDTTVSIPKNSVKSLGTEEPMVLEAIDTQPGSMLPVYVQYGTEQGKQILVPVLDGRQAEYTEYLP
jgi:hypothetical protein